MGGVDNVNKDKKIGWSFTKETHIKKWYRMGFMGILDFVAANGKLAWDMSVKDEECMPRRFKLNNWKFQLLLAEEMTKLKDEHSVSHFSKLALSNSPLNDHVPCQVQAGLHVRCCVCALEN